MKSLLAFLKSIIFRLEPDGIDELRERSLELRNEHHPLPLPARFIELYAVGAQHLADPELRQPGHGAELSERVDELSGASHDASYKPPTLLRINPALPKEARGYPDFPGDRIVRNHDASVPVRGTVVFHRDRRAC